MKIGPFFFIRNHLIYDACPLSAGRRQADKIDNSYGHEALYDKYFKFGDYIDFPRGRVVWDCSNSRAIVYIDPCIRKEAVLSQIRAAFDLTDYVVEGDDHYHCKKCVGALFED